jgi:hypothetical protein
MNDLLRSGTLALLVLSSTGCGLISSDVTNFNLDLPEKKFSIDTASWSVDPAAADTVLNTPCMTSDQCNTVAEAACAMDCSGTCNAANRCTMSLDVGLHQSVDLVMEKPELQSINDRPVIEVTIDAVTYSVTEYTLDVDTPEIGVYVAPMSVLDPTSPEAKKIGTIAPVPAGMTVSGKQLTFTADGKQQLVAAMNNFKTPFNVIVGATIVVDAEHAVPTGRLDAAVKIRAHAGL